ncbi:hypothetical protein QA802_07765 [Streptomyces sp. B21-105]|uniref:hypothetical protein n=1 Tax=Streptomyces sp. B21-105 TaxID=3039417 RepID=UPI002FF3FF3D
MTDQTPSQKPDLRDQLINALGQTDTIPPIAHRRAQADNVLAVLYREWPWLRAAAEDASPVPGSEREQRIRLDDLTSDALDALYEQLETAEENESQRQLATAREALASATTRAALAEHELAALRQVARGYCPACGRGDAGPTVNDWEQQKQRADAAEAVAEQDVTRVIALYEQWVKAGPPPLGTPTSRWWDARLAELHNTIRPPTNQPEHHTGTTPANQTAPYDQTNRPNQHRT